LTSFYKEGRLSPKRRGKPAALKITPEIEEFLIRRLSEDPDVTNLILAEEIESAWEMNVHPSTV
jgi:hypothetical protein